jgi:hypothetical protein
MIRHAFGNYKDILHEVSRSPIMSEFLTLAGSTSFEYNGKYPDENFAREIMQLFTIGLWQLEQNGTRKLDTAGEPIATYSNDDVATFAKIWTGFDYQLYRGNVEKPLFGVAPNFVDPTVLKPEWRDRFPKTKLDAGYVGDKNYPLCSELAPGHFLAKGATYQYLGTNSLEGAALDGGSWIASVQTVPEYESVRFAPSASESTLYNRLCAAGSTGQCTFPLEVVLDVTIPCHGMECRVEQVDSVLMVEGRNATKVWYSYVSPPCVNLALFNEGKYVNSEKYNSGWKDESHCVDPTTPAAAVICCAASTTSTSGSRENDIFNKEAPMGDVHLGIHAVHATEQVAYIYPLSTNHTLMHLCTYAPIHSYTHTLAHSHTHSHIHHTLRPSR